MGMMKLCDVNKMVANRVGMGTPHNIGIPGKVEKVMREFKKKKLHSGSKKGPLVKSRKQAVAIAMSEAGTSKK